MGAGFRMAVSVPFAAAAALAALVAALGAAQAQQATDWDAVEIVTRPLADGLYLLEGQGGNIAVSVGADGVLIVDTQFAPLSDRIFEAIAALSDAPVRVVVNTHHHGDHIGGNANFGAAGAIIVAHENARDRIRDSFEGPAPAHALPAVTFSDVLTIHFNGEEIRLLHVPAAHTDNDIFVHFVNADVIHAGDVFRTTSYPAVDESSGGRFQGILDAYGELQRLAGPQTQIAPGHGVVSGVEAVAEQLDMIGTIRARVDAARAEGKTLEEVVALNLTGDYDPRWSAGRWTGESVVTALYEAAQ